MKGITCLASSAQHSKSSMNGKLFHTQILSLSHTHKRQKDGPTILVEKKETPTEMYKIYLPFITLSPSRLMIAATRIQASSSLCNECAAHDIMSLVSTPYGKFKPGMVKIGNAA
jgi:hypothetical protein